MRRASVGGTHRTRSRPRSQSGRGCEMHDVAPSPKPRVRMLTLPSVDDHTLGLDSLHRGVTVKLLAGLMVTAPLVPTAASMISVVVYVQAFTSVPSTMAFLAHPLPAAVLALVGAWLALAVP